MAIDVVPSITTNTEISEIVSSLGDAASILQALIDGSTDFDDADLLNAYISLTGSMPDQLLSDPEIVDWSEDMIDSVAYWGSEYASLEDAANYILELLGESGDEDIFDRVDDLLDEVYNGEGGSGLEPDPSRLQQSFDLHNLSDVNDLVQLALSKNNLRFALKILIMYAFIPSKLDSQEAALEVIDDAVAELDEIRERFEDIDYEDQSSQGEIQSLQMKQSHLNTVVSNVANLIQSLEQMVTELTQLEADMRDIENNTISFILSR